jgi:hypothetical protein
MCSFVNMAAVQGLEPWLRGPEPRVLPTRRLCNMAEDEGFEPSETFRLHIFSKDTRSATPPIFHMAGKLGLEPRNYGVKDRRLYQFVYSPLT